MDITKKHLKEDLKRFCENTVGAEYVSLSQDELSREALLNIARNMVRELNCIIDEADYTIGLEEGTRHADGSYTN